MMKTGNPCSQDGALNIKNAWDPGGALTQSTHKMSGNVFFGIYPTPTHEWFEEKLYGYSLPIFV
jgi:hypothetical protein